MSMSKASPYIVPEGEIQEGVAICLSSDGCGLSVSVRGVVQLLGVPIFARRR